MLLKGYGMDYSVEYPKVREKRKPAIPSRTSVVHTVSCPEGIYCRFFSFCLRDSLLAENCSEYQHDRNVNIGKIGCQ